MTTPKRPVLPYFGGKWRLAPWVIDHLPPHLAYTEAFGGAASVLLRKERCATTEVYNDLNHEVVNLFRVLRFDPDAERLIALLQATPYSREEYLASYEFSDDPVEQARRTVLKFHMAFSPDCQRDGHVQAFRCGGRGKYCRTFAAFPGHLPAIVERLRYVTVEQQDALDVLRFYDGPDTLHFVDPPYLMKTRTSGKVYKYEMDEKAHHALAGVLHSLSGMVVLAGYPSALYDALYPGWHKVEKPARAFGGGLRTEVLWLSPSAKAALENARA